jgi:hypothetical protein
MVNHLLASEEGSKFSGRAGVSRPFGLDARTWNGLRPLGGFALFGVGADEDPSKLGDPIRQEREKVFFSGPVSRWAIDGLA